MRPVLALVCAAALSTAAENPFIEEGVRALRALDEASALKTFEKARAWKGNTPEQLALVNMYTGIAYAAVPREKEAVEAFKAARLLDPLLKLVLWASPRVREWWKRLGGEIEPEPVKASRLSGDKEATPDPPPEPLKPAPKDALAEAPAPELTPAVAAASTARRSFWVPLLIALPFVGFGIAGQVVMRGDANRLMTESSLSGDAARGLAADGKLWQGLSWVGLGVAIACAVTSVGLISFGGSVDPPEVSP